VLEPDYTNAFKKDKKLMERRHKDMLKLIDATIMITNEITRTGTHSDLFQP
jgi:mRNA-degrading endonuclease YafQ of YafQ-DinJ toxin-antitoxin module